MIEELKNRFGAHRISEIPGVEGALDLLIIDLELKTPVKLLMTNGFSNYCMPVPDKRKGYEYAELYFCLPSYWDHEDLDNPSMNWVFEWIQKIPAFIKERETWLGSGHTFSIGNENSSISPTMKENHFILVEPILLEDELKPVESGEKQIHFYGIVPIFSDEWDYKQGKGTLKLIKKLVSKGVSEKLDDYRTTTLKGKWRIW